MKDKIKLLSNIVGLTYDEYIEFNKKLEEKYDNLFKENFNVKEKINELNISKLKKNRLTNFVDLELSNKEIFKNEISVIKSSNDVDTLLNDYKDITKEEFIIINLDSHGKVINYDSIYKGTEDELLIRPREIFNYALSNNASSIIISHNHPSGNPKPSPNDLKTTKKLVEISKLTGINIIDHVILAKNDYYSMRENCDVLFINDSEKQSISQQKKTEIKQEEIKKQHKLVQKQVL